ncbi:MAG TPA: hypothetical protein VNK25_01265 [Candidatus Nitrosotenuis sp.]|nr:hypothetical protein [Candidatus Nitrosotenuis sp.]
MEQLKFILKSSFLYASLSVAFSTIGLAPFFGEILPQRYVIGNPLEVSGISPEHVIGHISFGLIAGLATLKLRYIVVAGLLPIALDADHLIQFLNLEAVPRLGHSVAFGLLAAPTMIALTGKKDLMLGAVSFSAVLSHISFDVLLESGSKFPFLIPFQNNMVPIQGADWIVFLAAAVAIIGTVSLLTKKAQPILTKHKSST